ncbi:MAG: TonB-dependent receptor [Deltaproteobacteria bacterium]|nr:TonB-dependent receptor [Deltaproteobacteria bacterium]
MAGSLLGVVLIVATSSGALAELPAGISLIATATSADEVGDLPLSLEELALLETLATATTSAPLLVPPIFEPPALGPASGRHLGRTRLVETGARTVVEALSLLPGLGWSHRGAERATLIYDGVELEPFPSSPGANGWLGVDPRFFGGVRLRPSAGLNASSDGARPSLELEHRPIPGAWSSEANTLLHSADRSSSLYGAVQGGVGPVSASLALAYLDQKPLRIAPEVDESARYGEAQRWNGSARLHLWGDEEAGLQLTAGGDLDRQQNQVIYDSLGRSLGRDELGQRHLGFLRLDWRGPRGSLFLVGAHQGWRRQRTDPNGERLDRADQLQLRGSAQYRLWGELEGEVGGLLAAGPSRGTGYRGRAQRAEAFVSLSSTWSRLLARASARYSHRQVELDEVGVAQADRLLAEGALELGVVGPLSLSAAFRQGHQLPTVEAWHQIRGRAQTLPQSTEWIAEVGPRLRFGDAFVDLVAYYQNRDEVLLPDNLGSTFLALNTAGLELEGAVPLGGFTFAGALAWAEVRGPADRPYLRSPSLEGLLSVRHDFAARQAFLEVHLRGGTSGLHLWSEAPAFQPDPYLRAGLRGGLDLGLGLSLLLAVENAFDRPIVLPDTLVPSAGLDLSASLTWAL